MPTGILGESLNIATVSCQVSGGLITKLLRQSDDDAFRAADIGKPIHVLVLHHFADQLGAVGKQTRDDVVDAFDGEHDATDPEFVHRSVLAPSSDRENT